LKSDFSLLLVPVMFSSFLTHNIVHSCIYVPILQTVFK
jgi:hypothetical protein